MHSPFVHRPTSVSFGSFRPWYLGATVLDAHVRQSACLKRPPRVAPFLGRGEEGLRLGDLLARRQFLGARKTGDCHGVCPAIAYKQHKSKLPCAHNSTRDILKKKKKKRSANCVGQRSPGAVNAEAPRKKGTGINIRKPLPRDEMGKGSRSRHPCLRDCRLGRYGWERRTASSPAHTKFGWHTRGREAALGDGQPRWGSVARDAGSAQLDFRTPRRQRRSGCPVVLSVSFVSAFTRCRRCWTLRRPAAASRRACRRTCTEEGPDG